MFVPDVTRIEKNVSRLERIKNNMPTPDPRYTPLEEGTYYHIYNRANGNENIFRETRNYEYFFRKYVEHAEPYAELYAYCLLKNHFHLLVKIKPGSRRDTFLENVSRVEKTRDASQAFANWFTAYAKGYNKTYARHGSLLQRPFRRIPVTSERYLLNLVRYIHRNPQKHGFVKDFREWVYSSYPFISNVTGFRKPVTFEADVTGLWRPVTSGTVLEWFGGLKAFEEFHRDAREDAAVRELIGEDD